MSSEVILYSSDETGAPAMAAATAGGMIAVLDACLVNGFNAKTPTQIVVASGVATATVSAHGYLKGRKLLHAGSTTTALNGVKKILAVPSSNTYTFDATGVADGTYTAGSLTVKRAPLGWTKVYGDTTHGMYARTDVAATSQMLRVDDSATSAVRVIGVESATDINTYVNAFPTNAQRAGGSFWVRHANYTATNLVWYLVGDGLSFYIFVPNPNVGSPLFMPMGFGDVVSLKAGDAYKSFLGASQSDDTTTYFLSGNFSPSVGNVANGPGGYVCRDLTGVSQPTVFNNLNHGNSYMGYTNMPLFPSPVDGGLVICDKVAMIENSTLQNCPIRGFLPGIAEPLASMAMSISGTVLAGVSGLNREYLAMTTVASNASGAHVLVDVTGPWQ